MDNNIIYNVDINFINDLKYTLYDINNDDLDIIMKCFLKRKRTRLYLNTCVDFSKAIGIMAHKKD